MAHYLLLPPQKFSLVDLAGQFPTGFPNKKYFFQCEVRNIIAESNDLKVRIGLIAYPAWRKGNAARQLWRLGTPVRGVDIREANPADPEETIVFDPNNPNTWIALANNEVFLGPGSGLEGKISPEIEERHARFIKLHLTILKSKYLKTASLEFKSRVSKNPHVYYDVLLTDGTNSELYDSNPCPPNRPGE